MVFSNKFLSKIGFVGILFSGSIRIIQQQRQKMNNIQKRFLHGFWWNLAGSISYESLKTIHCFLLLQFLNAQVYGFVGSLFSIVYLATRIADFGATNSIPPFHNLFTRNKQNFKQFLTHYSLIPHLPLILAGAFIVLSLAIKKSDLVSPPLYLFVLPTIVVLETIRSFFRQLLHTIFKSKVIVIAELIIFIIYLLVIWIPFLFGTPLTLNLIFIPHLADSLLALIVFGYMIRKFYHELPSGKLELPSKLWKRLTFTKTHNYLLRISRHMFTSNFLTPLFALKFGLKSAGIFYFASTLASMVQAIIRSLVSYSGGALFANLKDSPQAEKKAAFNLLCEKLVHVIAPVIIFLSINYRAIIRLGSSANMTNVTLSLALLFLIISFTEFFFVLYEQFYIIEEAAGKLFVFKLLELAIFYGLITAGTNESQISTLLSIIVIRFVSFAIIAVNAYYNWRITPNFKANYKFLATSFLVSLIIAYFL